MWQSQREQTSQITFAKAMCNVKTLSFVTKDFENYAQLSFCNKKRKEKLGNHGRLSIYLRFNWVYNNGYGLGWSKLQISAFVLHSASQPVRTDADFLKNKEWSS